MLKIGDKVVDIRNSRLGMKDEDWMGEITSFNPNYPDHARVLFKTHYVEEWVDMSMLKKV